MTASKKVKCPQCGLLALYTPENPFRPFCSERCRLIDLGQWADGTYAIPVDKSSEAYQDVEDENGESDGGFEPPS